MIPASGILRPRPPRRAGSTWRRCARRSQGSWWSWRRRMRERCTSEPIHPCSGAARRRGGGARRRAATLGATMAYDILVAASDSHGVIPVSYDDDVHPFSDLMAGRVDAVLLDHIIAERSLHRLRGTAFIVEPRAVAVGHYVGVLARADSVLRDSVDVVLRAAMVDGTLERIVRRWNVWDESQGAAFRRVG